MIARDPQRVASKRYDLLVVGGGIHGAMIAMQGARCGLRTCLAEAGDFGSGTSWNSLRILHGGLRYLQTLDLRRFRASVTARRWYARAFPSLVRPVPCLMPLYHQGLRRRSVMRLALLMNDGLGWWRNSDVAEALRIPSGATLSPDAVRARFPLTREECLEGGAEWTDYFMVSSERVLIETLRRACRFGADVLNYARVIDVTVENHRVAGVRVQDELSGAAFDVPTSQVVNCTGPGIRALAGRFAPDPERLFRPSLAFNLLLSARLPSDRAMAVSAPRPGAPVLFLVPQKETVLAGTCHLPRPAEVVTAEPTLEEIERFLFDIRAAVPGWHVGVSQVCRLFAGLLPVRTAGTADLTTREVVYDHSTAGGPVGLFSICGIKFTTAPIVAAAVLRRLGHRSDPLEQTLENRGVSPATPILTDAKTLLSGPTNLVREALLQTTREECVRSADDLVLRRTNWATTEPHLAPCYRRVAALLGDADGWLGSSPASGAVLARL